MIIDKLLASAVKLYLRSQVEKVKNLKVKITAKDRQILGGQLPQVFIAANSAIYQGIYLRQLEVTGNNILLNLPEVLERKPLKLLEPIIVNLRALLTESDLQHSLESDLFLNGLTDFWQDLLQQQAKSFNECLTDYSKITWQKITLQDNLLTILGTPKKDDNAETEIAITTDLYLSNPQTLMFTPLDIQGIPELIGQNWQPLKIDLGSEVKISDLSISNNQLLMSGEITIFP